MKELLSPYIGREARPAGPEGEVHKIRVVFFGGGGRREKKHETYQNSELSTYINVLGLG